MLQISLVGKKKQERENIIKKLIDLGYEIELKKSQLFVTAKDFNHAWELIDLEF